MPSTGTISDYLAHGTLNASVNDGAFPTISAVYVGLSKTTIAAAGTGATLPSSGSPAWSNYANVQVAAASLDAAASRAKTNNAEFDFGTATTNGDVDLTDWFLADASDWPSSGNLLWFGKLNGTITVQNGNPVKVPVGDLDIAFSATQGTPS